MRNKTQKGLTALLTGAVFGLGLAVSRMTDPDVVLAFLNVTGQWDPRLLLTMAGAIGVTFFGYRVVLKGQPVFDDIWHLPEDTPVNQRTMIGALIFGLGWGMAGYCPGPAITGLAAGILEPAVFLLAMFLGSQLEGFWQHSHPIEIDQ